MKKIIIIPILILIISITAFITRQYFPIIKEMVEYRTFGYLKCIDYQEDDKIFYKTCNKEEINKMLENLENQKNQIIKERQKLLCEKASGIISETDSLQNMDTKEWSKTEITCITKEGPYIWKDDNFILEKTLK